jgi:hypothetical protein
MVSYQRYDAYRNHPAHHAGAEFVKFFHSEVLALYLYQRVDARHLCKMKAVGGINMRICSIQDSWFYGFGIGSSVMQPKF